MNSSQIPHHRQDGSMLLEALIAILIFSMGIIALMGLQAMAIKNSVESKYRTDASFLANQIIGQMWTDKTNFATYSPPPATWQTQVGTTLPNGVGSIAIVGDMATVTVTWQAPGSSPHKFMEIARINY